MVTDNKRPYPFLICDTPDAAGIDCTGTVLTDADGLDRCSAHFAKRWGLPDEAGADA